MEDRWRAEIRSDVDVPGHVVIAADRRGPVAQSPGSWHAPRSPDWDRAGLACFLLLASYELPARPRKRLDLETATYRRRPTPVKLSQNASYRDQPHRDAILPGLGLAKVER